MNYYQRQYNIITLVSALYVVVSHINDLCSHITIIKYNVVHQPHTIQFRMLHGGPSEYQLRIPNHVCTLYGQNVTWKRKVLYPIKSHNPNIITVNLSQDISLFQYRLSICYTALVSPHSILSAHTHTHMQRSWQKDNVQVTLILLFCTWMKTHTKNSIISVTNVTDNHCTPWTLEYYQQKKCNNNAFNASIKSSIHFVIFHIVSYKLKQINL
jgi:hypothetical protein